MEIKDGWKTTEFWIVVLPMLAGIALIFRGEIESALMLLGGSGVGAIYGAGRSFMKGKATEADGAVKATQATERGKIERVHIEKDTAVAVAKIQTGTGGGAP